MFLCRVLADENSIWLLGNLITSLSENLFALRLLLRSMKDLPDYIIIHSGNSHGNKVREKTSVMPLLVPCCPNFTLKFPLTKLLKIEYMYILVPHKSVYCIIYFIFGLSPASCFSAHKLLITCSMHIWTFAGTTLQYCTN